MSANRGRAEILSDKAAGKTLKYFRDVLNDEESCVKERVQRIMNTLTEEDIEFIAKDGALNLIGILLEDLEC